MDTYLVVLGRETALGAAELRTLFQVADPGATISTVASDVVLVQPSEQFDATTWMERLGGSRLIAKVLGETSQVTAETLNNFLPSAIREIAISSPAVSAKERMKLLLELKKLRQGLRYRPTNDAYLASGLSERLIRREDGAELLVLRHNERFVIGQVVAVQDAREWTDRDRGLPAVDAVAGLLPPKLARIMVNLAEPARPADQEGVLLDPFCGSGQIPIEALRLGWQVRASDLDGRAVERTTTNTAWAIDHYQLTVSNLLDIASLDVAAVTETVAEHSVDALVAEPDLGPALRASDPTPPPVILDRVAATVAAAFTTGQRVIRPGGRLVLVIPIIAGVRIYDRLDDSVQNGYILRESFTYARPDARVEREIFVFDRQ